MIIELTCCAIKKMENPEQIGIVEKWNDGNSTFSPIIPIFHLSII